MYSRSLPAPAPGADFREYIIKKEGEMAMKENAGTLLGGCLRLRLTGSTPERFFNLCRANRITVWNLQCAGGRYEFCVGLKDFYRIRPYARKAGVRVRIAGRLGLPFFLQRNRKRAWYAGGVLVFFAILFVMSRFLWAISISGNFTITEDTFLHYLDDRDIRYGTFKHRVDCDALEEEIRSSFPEIIWVSARISGTQLKIRVKENDGVPVREKGDTEPSHLVADMPGTITRMIVRQGKPQVRIGDQVEAGQLLVSGIVPIYDDSQTLVKENLVRADADIYARTSLEYQEQIPKYRQVRSYSGNVRHGIGLRIGPVNFLGILPWSQKHRWQTTVQERQVCLLEDFYLPVWISRIEKKEYELYDQFLTNEEVLAKKENIHQEKLQNFRKKGVPIIENNVKIQDKGSCYEVQGSFLLELKIGTGQKIPYGPPPGDGGQVRSASGEPASGTGTALRR